MCGSFDAYFESEFENEILPGMMGFMTAYMAAYEEDMSLGAKDFLLELLGSDMDEDDEMEQFMLDGMAVILERYKDDLDEDAFANDVEDGTFGTESMVKYSSEDVDGEVFALTVGKVGDNWKITGVSYAFSSIVEEAHSWIQ